MWFIVDACGIVCVILTYTLISLAFLGGYSLSNLDTTLGNISFFGLIVCLVLAGLSHLKCMLTDPGAVPSLSPDVELENIPKGELRWRNGEYVSVCNKCHTYKPDRAHHCRFCGRCVRKMDHHCPWINNCVGEFNQKHFIQFTSYIFLSAFFMILILVNFFKTCNDINDCLFSSDGNGSAPLTVLGVCMEVFVFGLFTLIMTCDQLYNISYDTSTIDKKKGNKGQSQPSALDNLAEVFGSKFGVQWFLPFSIHPRTKSRFIDHVV
eukprot:m.2993 g.2993  ORF g.2993 m.2993 type:complete len:265 (-) comp1998_c0_seq1:209-1003(-)